MELIGTCIAALCVYYTSLKFSEKIIKKIDNQIKYTKKYRKNVANKYKM